MGTQNRKNTIDSPLLQLKSNRASFSFSLLTSQDEDDFRSACVVGGLQLCCASSWKPHQR